VEAVPQARSPHTKQAGRHPQSTQVILIGYQDRAGIPIPMLLIPNRHSTPTRRAGPIRGHHPLPR
ncbi:MAG TPA: hypothetical protein VEL31_01540, partial [Ktedonobacteraceae bacterium]|nr:hypothetical protein [Ktedonobacteraceae bacterium]